MDNRKSSDDFKRKPNKKSSPRYQNTTRPSRNQSASNNIDSQEIYSRSNERSVDLNSVRSKRGKESNLPPKRKFYIAANILLACIMVIAGCGIGVKGYWNYKNNQMGNSKIKNNVDAAEKGNFDDIVVSPDGNVAYFLVVGVDLSENLTDVIMVVSFDLVNNKASILQIPRDTYVGNATSTGKINAIFGSAKQGESKIKALMRCVNDQFGLPIDHYITVTIPGTEDIIDHLGGIDITLKQDFNLVDDSRKPEQKKFFAKGKQHLNGQWATALLRHRKSFAQGDTGRVKNQRSVYAAVLKELTKMSLTEVYSIANDCMGDIATDLKLGQIMGFAQKARNLSLKDVNIYTVPGQGQTIKGQSCWVCHRQELVDILNKYMFTPFYDKNDKSTQNKPDKVTYDSISILDTDNYSSDYNSFIEGGDLENFDNDATTTTTTTSSSSN